MAGRDNRKQPALDPEGRVWTDVTFRAALRKKEEERASVAAKKAAAAKARDHLAELRKKRKAWKATATAAHKAQLAIDMAEWRKALAAHKASKKTKGGRAPTKPAARLKLVVPEHLCSPENSSSEREDLGDLGGEEIEEEEEEEA